MYQFDKRYDFSFKRNPHNKKLTIILYSQVGTNQFQNFHEKILSLAETNAPNFEIDYLLRHNYVPVHDSRKVPLSGYGVELDIKSTEYKNKDDTKVNTDDLKSQSSQKNINEDEPIQGFMFNKLKQLNPSLSEKLEEYRKHLLESALELAPLAPWQMQVLF